MSIIHNDNIILCNIDSRYISMKSPGVYYIKITILYLCDLKSNSRVGDFVFIKVFVML